MFKTLNEGWHTTARLKAKAGHDPLGLNHGELFPCCTIDFDCRLYAVLLFDRLKPETVMGEPVPFGITDPVAREAFRST